MRRISSTLHSLVYIIVFVLTAKGQNKHDFNWVSGIEINNIHRLNKINFNDDTIKISNEFYPFSFLGTNSNISDREGNLLLYFNGCELANGKGELLENGTDFFGSTVSNEVCSDKKGYSGPFQSSLILPVPNKENHFYLFYPRVLLTPMREEYSILHAEIDMNQNGGRGKVLYKNKHI